MSLCRIQVSELDNCESAINSQTGHIDYMAYYIYIITNKERTSLYIGVTRSIRVRLRYHRKKVGTNLSWAGRHHCEYLIYYEEFKWILNAIRREKQLKGWRRSKKEWLINRINPDWEELAEPG